MRAHSGEHGDCLPELDVSRTKHLAHVLDAFAYFLRAKTANKPVKTLSRHEQFFLRSDSIVESGAVVSPVFTTPFKEALPLADRPDRLHPSSSKSSLFGAGRLVAEENSTPPPHLGMSSRLSGSYQNILHPPGLTFGSPGAGCLPSASALDSSLSESMVMQTTPGLEEMPPDVMFERWKLVIGLFIKMFLPTVGSERESFLVKLAGFKVKESRFRERMEKLIRTLPESSSSDLKLTGLGRERTALLSDLYSKLKIHQETRKHKTLYAGLDIFLRRITSPPLNSRALHSM